MKDDWKNVKYIEVKTSEINCEDNRIIKLEYVGEGCLRYEDRIVRFDPQIYNPIKGNPINISLPYNNRIMETFEIINVV